MWIHYDAYDLFMPTFGITMHILKHIIIDHQTLKLASSEYNKLPDKISAPQQRHYLVKDSRLYATIKSTSKLP